MKLRKEIQTRWNLTKNFQEVRVKFSTITKKNFFLFHNINLNYKLHYHSRPIFFSLRCVLRNVRIPKMYALKNEYRTRDLIRSVGVKTWTRYSLRVFGFFFFFSKICGQVYRDEWSQSDTEYRLNIWYGHWYAAVLQLVDSLERDMPLVSLHLLAGAPV